MVTNRFSFKFIVFLGILLHAPLSVIRGAEQWSVLEISCTSAKRYDSDACDERYMPTNFQDIQRHMFWSCVPSGAVGHTGFSSHAYLAIVTATNGTWKAPHVPSPQDWVLVLEQAGVGVARCEKTIGQRWRLVTFTPDDAGFDQATALLKRERANAVLSRPAFIIEKP